MMQCFPTGLIQQLKWNKNVCYNKLDIQVAGSRMTYDFRK